MCLLCHLAPVCICFNDPQAYAAHTHKLAGDDTNQVFSQEDMDLLTSLENGLDHNQIK